MSSMFDSSVVILTGAGISAESGIKTFRDNDGLWENHRIEDVATPIAWMNNPELVWNFYQTRRRQLMEVKPNPAHYALAKLEEGVNEFTLITQNVDDLHERGGSSNVIHMHGTLRTLRCEVSQKHEERMKEEDLVNDFLFCTCCAEPNRVRPDIVWFGEMPMYLEEIYEAVEHCDFFIVIGSSGHVYPAADLVNVARSCSAKTILINFESPANAFAFDEIHLGKAGEILPDLVNSWLEK